MPYSTSNFRRSRHTQRTDDTPGASASTNTWSVVLGAGAETDASGVLGSETAARTRTACAARARTWPRARDTGATPVAKEEAAAALAIVLGLRVSGPQKECVELACPFARVPGCARLKSCAEGDETYASTRGTRAGWERRACAWTLVVGARRTSVEPTRAPAETAFCHV